MAALTSCRGPIMNEAQQRFGQRGHATLLQNMVDRGEAATLEEASKISCDRMRATALQKMGYETPRVFKF